MKSLGESFNCKHEIYSLCLQGREGTQKYIWWEVK